MTDGNADVVVSFPFQRFPHAGHADLRRAYYCAELHISEIHSSGRTSQQRFWFQAQQLMAELPQQQRLWHHLWPCPCESASNSYKNLVKTLVFTDSMREKYESQIWEPEVEVLKLSCRRKDQICRKWGRTENVTKLMSFCFTLCLRCRSRHGCFLVNLVPGSIRWTWMETRPPSSMMLMARSASIPEPSWLRRTTGWSVTPTASMSPTGRLQSAVVTTLRWRSNSYTHSQPPQPETSLF